MKTHFILAIGLLGAFLTTEAAEKTLTLTSPDGSARLQFMTDGARARFNVTRENTVVIESSPLIFTLDGVDVTSEAEVGETKTTGGNETYPWLGAHSPAVNHFTGLRVTLNHPKATGLTLEARAFNDAVAFRLIAAGEASATRVPDERTVFTLPAGSTAWYHGLGGHYEDTYQRKDVSEVKAGEWAGPPVTFKLPNNGGYACITEAALVNYAGMALEADGMRGWVVGLGHRQPINYPFQLRYGEAEHQRLSKPAAISGTITTPWRVVMLGADLNALVNCDALHNLCPPADPKLFPTGMETEWVKPGRAVWKYLDGGQNSLEEVNNFSRWAGELGFEFQVIEGFWRRWSAEELRGAVELAKQRKVGLWLWRHSNQLRTPEARAAFWKQCTDAGAVGVKLDFFDHESKEVVDLYELLLREAAEHRLMVNFHGANKPTGMMRTWPNELTREAVRGMESSRLQERARHDAILPFTRFLAGPADYTPVHFGTRRADTTISHQIATAAIFAGPLLTYGAYPSKLLESPAMEMIRSIPAVWDETRVLKPSEIGECAIFARRKGQTWFLAIINGPRARKVEVPLAFLADGEYPALMVSDDPVDAGAVKVERKTARRGEGITIDLSPGGGLVARFGGG